MSPSASDHEHEHEHDDRISSSHVSEKDSAPLNRPERTHTGQERERDLEQKQEQDQEQGQEQDQEQDQDQDQDHHHHHQDEAHHPPTKPSLMHKLDKLWAKTQLDSRTLKTMAKGALAPTISLAAYQATDFAEIYTTLGYLVGIISILSFAIMPRAKFLQTWIYNVLSACLSAAVALLAIYCAIKARQHTEAQTDTGGATSGSAVGGAATVPYNSSAAAVCGIWLFFEIWLVNTMRARNPQLMIPGIIWCIFANVSMVYGPQFGTMATGIRFVRRLLESFLTGFAIGGAVSLFVFPVTMRGVVFKEMTGYLVSLRKLVAADMAYIHSLEETDMFFRADTNIPDRPKRSPEAKAVKDLLAALSALHGKLSVDLTFAKREIAYGKLGPDDLQAIFRHLRGLLQPVSGLSSLVDLFERRAREKHWDHPPPNVPLDQINDPDERDRIEAVQDWHAIMRAMRDPFDSIAQDIDQGFEHILITLQLIKPPKPVSSTDAESAGDQPRPGDKAFADYHAKKVHAFHYQKRHLLRKWCSLRGIQLTPDFFNSPQTAEFKAPDWYFEQTMSKQRQVYRGRLYLVLYMDFLLDSIARAVHDFVVFADSRADSKMTRKRLIVPGLKRFRKWVISSWSRRQDAYTDEQHGMNDDGAESSNVWLGEAYNKRKDPEHLPARNRIEKIGNRVRHVAHFLRSPASAFGFRVACATMCLAIISFLHDTQSFYVRQRLFWSQIMVTISMSPSAGQSAFSFILRIAGTTAAMITSFIIWYIVDGHTAGVLVFYWFFVSWGFYIVMKHPRIIPVGMIYCVTNTLIIGYELQVRKIGVAVSETNGQAVYPIYVLAPYRLATVCAGLFVAWIWTIFPFPISEHSELRRHLGSSLYLLANYYSVVSETVKVRVRGEELFMDDKRSPARRLEKMRQVVYSKSLLLIQALRTHSTFTKFDVPVGGKFPRETYDRLINRIQDVLNFASLIQFASTTFTERSNELRSPSLDSSGKEDTASQSQWLLDFRRLIHDSGSTSREITALLTLLSASISSGQPLPPYLKPPEPYALSSKLDHLDHNILSVRHMAEPGFAAFAVMQIATKCVSEDLEALLADIKELVGELDFSFHVVSTAETSSADSSSANLLDNVRQGATDDQRKGKND